MRKENYWLKYIISVNVEKNHRLKEYVSAMYYLFPREIKQIIN